MTLAVSIAQSGANNVTMRNKIINGAMAINQRGSGTLTLSGSGQYAVDQFSASKDTSSATCTIQQNTSSLTAGFNYSLLWTTTTGAASASNEDSIVSNKIEGYNFADFGFGSANAKSFTLSFWVKSSLTGTYGISLSNNAADRCFMATYTVNSANTWEQKTITVVGDTTGTWLTTNGLGLRIFFDLGSGSGRSIAASSAWGSSYGTGLTGGVKISQNTGATWQITGVQLEAGTTATAFEQRLYGTELALCQRYYENGGTTYQNSGIGGVLTVPFKVNKRATPTLTATGNYYASAEATGRTLGSTGDTTWGFYINNTGNFTGAVWNASAEL